MIVNWNKNAPILIVETFSSPSSQTAASGKFQITYDVSKAGYTPIGVVGLSINRTNGLLVQGMRVSGNNVVIDGYNSSGGDLTLSTVSTHILYKRN